MAAPFKPVLGKKEPVSDERFPTGLRLPKNDLDGKGEKGKRCNVNACQLPNTAYHLNLVMNKYYCYHCAKDIQEANPSLLLFEDFHKKI